MRGGHSGRLEASRIQLPATRPGPACRARVRPWIPCARPPSLSAAAAQTGFLRLCNMAAFPAGGPQAAGGTAPREAVVSRLSGELHVREGATRAWA